MLKPFIIGALGGVGVAFLSWMFISKKLDQEFQGRATSLLDEMSPGLRQEIQRTLDREVPTRVRTEIRRTLNSYGITEATGRQISSVLATADRMGLI